MRSSRASLTLLLVGCLLSGVSSDFRYPDFATVCEPTIACSPDFEGTLSCCLPFSTDAESMLTILSGAHFQTCAQADSPTGEVEGLKGKASVSNQDTAQDPQINIRQSTVVDYVASPRMSVTTNWTRSVFEEVVRRRNELRADLLVALDVLAQSKIDIQKGLEPDAEGQIWLIIAMQQAKVDNLRMLYNLTLGRDLKLYNEHRGEYLAIFPYNDYERLCDNRMRLTPAAPTRRGSVWFTRMQEVTYGFTTSFKFQLSARNRFCRQKVEAHSDQQKGRGLTVHYDECQRMEWNATEWSDRIFGIGGGDGFAFVIQTQGPDAMGTRGNENGFGGIENSVAIEFDTYLNKDIGDVNDMHVAVHTGGCRQRNSAHEQTLLSSYAHLRSTGRFIQDGAVHEARIEYTPGLDFNPDTQPNWSSSEYAQTFVKSDGMGTLRVFLDDMDEAVINMPISLKYALRLETGKAYVGFTASTGDMWQNHDILSWEFKEYVSDPEAACSLGILKRAQCLEEKRWPLFQGAALTGTPYFEPGANPWEPSFGSVCTTCP
uniref:Legume lectin domain-containing protein n=1 Tax=Hemiselmis andersenii TaxID=464988 RepID=A0A7S1MTS5_HEMAN|mmetsp:Transcript_55479/g.134283  ORF Transcript_55479/g.134283 Transcript_55479/m.134283 type:complete len:544 (+) Transcript_55479:80-1711(+)